MNFLSEASSIPSQSTRKQSYFINNVAGSSSYLKRNSDARSLSTNKGSVSTRKQIKSKTEKPSFAMDRCHKPMSICVLCEAPVAQGDGQMGASELLHQRQRASNT